MVIDSSALIAIFFNEPERRLFDELIEADPTKLISAATFLETAMVLERRAGHAPQLDRFIREAPLEIVSFTREQAALAREAFQRYGKGRHLARLNFGDCFTYALCKVSGEPLLPKGEDFKRTDLKLVAC
jgi:ribonuclease VapC